MDTASSLFSTPTVQFAFCFSEFQQLFAERKIKRTSSYSHLRALINSLRTSTGHDLLQFVLPKDVICRPLLPHETRYLHEGLYHVHCGLTNTTRPQLGNLGKSMFFALMLFSTVIDQGSVGSSAMAFAMKVLKLVVALNFDPFHRAWNDMRNAMKKCKRFLWEAILSCTLIFNVGYGPFGSSSWFEKKQEWLQSLLVDSNANSELFRRYAPFIAKERQLQELRSQEDFEVLFESLADTPHIMIKGPLCKLGNWFSFFRCRTYFTLQSSTTQHSTTKASNTHNSTTQTSTT